MLKIEKQFSSFIDRFSKIFTSLNQVEIHCSWKWCEQGKRLTFSLSWNSSMQIVHCNLSSENERFSFRLEFANRMWTYSLVHWWFQQLELNWFDFPRPVLGHYFHPFDLITKIDFSRQIFFSTTIDFTCVKNVSKFPVSNTAPPPCWLCVILKIKVN